MGALDTIDRYRALFAAECSELLQGVERVLAAPDGETVQVLFRAAHTIKSGAASLDIAPASDFAHRLETTLEAARSGRLVPDAALCDLFQQAFDCLGDLTSGIDQPERAAQLLRQLAALDRPPAVEEAYQLFDAPAVAPAPAMVSEAAPVASSGAAAASTIRVSATRLETLGDQSGELAIMVDMLKNQLKKLARGRQRIDLLCRVDQIQAGLRQVCDTTLAVRAQPVAQVFERMGRVARDAATATGKLVELVIACGEVELDLTMIDRLAEPLTHLVRNAIAHGLELPAARRLAGKPDCGTIALQAACRGGTVVLTISDDGAGLNEARLRIKYPDCAHMPATELIFRPGTSTAERLTDLAGRGVGLDAVRQSINSLGGKVGVTSCSDAGTSGTTFTITLPLTLAVLDGMAVRIGAETYILPMTLMQAALPTAFFTDREWRNRRLTILRMTRAGPVPIEGAITEKIVMILESEGYDPFGLAVDTVLGQQSFVIKPLPPSVMMNARLAFSSATVLEDGGPALVCNGGTLAQAATTWDCA